MIGHLEIKQNKINIKQIKGYLIQMQNKEKHNRMDEITTTNMHLYTIIYRETKD